MKQESRRTFRISDMIRRLFWSGKIVQPEPCTHFDQIQEVSPRTQGCEECLQTGDEWVHLRMCLVCGHVGCCDNSKNRHATRHFHTTRHPIIKSLEPGENWMWCYLDDYLHVPA